MEGKEAAIRTQGSAAWLALKIDKKTDKPISILWGTNGGNPLKMTIQDNRLLLASDISNLKDIDPKIANEIQVKDIFGKKDLQKITIGQKTLDLTPLFEPEPEWKSRTHNRTIGFHTHNKSDSDKKTKEIPPTVIEKNYDEEYERWKLEDPRMNAFDKMHQRIAENIAKDLEELFDSLTVEDVDDITIEDHVDNISEYLFEAKNRAAKARNFFDRQEQRNYTQSLIEDVNELTKLS